MKFGQTTVIALLLLFVAMIEIRGDEKEDAKLSGLQHLTGKPCPELYLADAMLQGKPVSQLDFAGKVVFIDVYQLD